MTSVTKRVFLFICISTLILDSMAAVRRSLGDPHTLHSPFLIAETEMIAWQPRHALVVLNGVLKQRD